MNTCSKLVAKVGRGIILWDRDRMLAFKDDPFMNQALGSGQRGRAKEGAERSGCDDGR